MKVAFLGDGYVPVDMMMDGFSSWKEMGCEFVGYQWDQNGMDFSEVNLLLELNGPEVIELKPEVLELVADADVIITQFCPINKAVIDAAPKCKAVGTMRAGVENICVDYMTEKGIVVCNNAGRNAEAVSDFAIGMMLAEYRNIARSHAGILKGEWRKKFINLDYIPDFTGLTVGIVGFGMIGQLVAKKLQGWDMKLLAYDAFPDHETAKKYGVEFVSLNDLMAQSDIVTVHCRLIPETERMIGREQINLMKPEAILVNTARNGLLDEDAIFDALNEKRIGGAALDVFDDEPIPADSRWLTLDNLTMTSHLAGTTIHAVTRTPLRLANHMAKLFEGEAPRTWINRNKVELVKLEV